MAVPKKKTVAKKATVKKVAVPKKRLSAKTPTTTSASGAKKSVVKKVAVPKKSIKKTAAKKATPKRVTPKKVTSKKAVPKKVTPKKASVKKVPATKPAAKKAAAKKTAAKKAQTTTKKAVAKKVTSKKAAVRKTASKQPTEKSMTRPGAAKVVVRQFTLVKPKISLAFAKRSEVSRPTNLVQVLSGRAYAEGKRIVNRVRSSEATPHLARAEAIRPPGLTTYKPWHSGNGQQAAWAPQAPPPEASRMIRLMVRDPWWLYTFWNVNPADERAMRHSLQPSEISGLKRALRVTNVSKHIHWDIEISDFADSWYINSGSPGDTFKVAIGIVTAQGRFMALAESESVTTPAVGPQHTDEHWAISEETYWELLSVTLGEEKRRTPIQIRRVFEKQISSGMLFDRELSSIGVSSFGGSIGLQLNRGKLAGDKNIKAKPGKDRYFFLEVNTELIVYGRTMPNADVTVQGKAIQLREDGTFSLRMMLPDGIQNIPVEAISPDRVEKRSITPVVTRQTHTQQTFLQKVSEPQQDTATV